MLPRFHSLFMALIVALLLVVGTLGIVSAEASAFRSTLRDAQTLDQASTVDAYDYAVDAQPMPWMAGQSAY
jgi:hypothetical protein